ncbi:hypothetical protein ANN_03685 [Periplaneta americana]|uniref:Uncharacterized protein n=1 Tax=Periplaneta americana TaxID=6978 RepID=A0ABQ8U1N4_PERAM|nr:hypothetical protein ANN_03685 [Periplaneta americana]
MMIKIRKGEEKTRCRHVAYFCRRARSGPPGLSSTSDGRITINNRILKSASLLNKLRPSLPERASERCGTAHALAVLFPPARPAELSTKSSRRFPPPPSTDRQLLMDSTVNQGSIASNSRATAPRLPAPQGCKVCDMGSGSSDKNSKWWPCNLKLSHHHHRTPSGPSLILIRSGLPRVAMSPARNLAEDRNRIGLETAVNELANRYEGSDVTDASQQQFSHGVYCQIDNNHFAHGEEEEEEEEEEEGAVERIEAAIIKIWLSASLAEGGCLSTFPTLKSYLESTDEELPQEVQHVIVEHLNDLATSFRDYFQQILKTHG